MAPGGRRAYDWRPWTRPSPEATAEGAASPAANRRIGRGRIHSATLTGLFILACVYTLSVAREFLMPLAIGLILYFLLRPPVRALKAARIPEPLGAALVLVALITVVGIGVYSLSFPAAAWAA